MFGSRPRYSYGRAGLTLYQELRRKQGMARRASSSAATQFGLTPRRQFGGFRRLGTPVYAQTGSVQAGSLA
jgi:hypothetical protein